MNQTTEHRRARTYCRRDGWECTRCHPCDEHRADPDHVADAIRAASARRARAVQAHACRAAQ